MPSLRHLLLPVYVKKAQSFYISKAPMLVTGAFVQSNIRTEPSAKSRTPTYSLPVGTATTIPLGPGSYTDLTKSSLNVGFAPKCTFEMIM